MKEFALRFAAAAAGVIIAESIMRMYDSHQLNKEKRLLLRRYDMEQAERALAETNAKAAAAEKAYAEKMAAEKTAS